jgi:hypothetical protein
VNRFGRGGHGGLNQPCPFKVSIRLLAPLRQVHVGRADRFSASAERRLLAAAIFIERLAVAW